MRVTVSKIFLALTTAIALTASGAALAAGVHENAQAQGRGHAGGHEHGDHGHMDSMSFGAPGKKSEASRTIEIIMKDNFFEPETLTVQAGETVRFVVKNKGEFLHEFNIGTAVMHAVHQKEMMTMMEHGMISADGVGGNAMKMDHKGTGKSGHVHDDPNSVLVDPGKTRELVWKFSKAADLEFACNVPGHYDSGMVGKIRFGTKHQSGASS